MIGTSTFERTKERRNEGTNEVTRRNNEVSSEIKANDPRQANDGHHTIGTTTHDLPCCCSVLSSLTNEVPNCCGARHEQGDDDDATPK